jgi:hypothetical protein
MKFGKAFFSTTVTLLFASAQAVPTAAAETKAGSLRRTVEDQGVAARGIDWDNVIRVLGSMVECETLIPAYEVIYFPSASRACLTTTARSWSSLSFYSTLSTIPRV